MMKNRHRVFSAAMGCVLLLCAKVSADIPTERIEQAGFAPERLQKINEFVQRDIEAGRVSGAVTLVARHGQLVHFSAQGNFGSDDARPLQEDTLFRIYSMTKPITTVAAMMLYEAGAFHLGDPVSRYLPEFESVQLLRDGELVAPQRPVTIGQLMTHTA